MVNKEIQPQLYDLEIIMPDGKKLNSKSTFSKGVFKAERAFSEHPAWTGEGRNTIIQSSERVEKANKRLQGISLLDLE